MVQSGLKITPATSERYEVHGQKVTGLHDRRVISGIVHMLRTGARWRDWLAERGCGAVTPPNPTRKHPHTYDKNAWRWRNVVERMFFRLKDFRRIATRYDKRAVIFLSAVFLAAAIVWWTN